MSEDKKKMPQFTVAIPEALVEWLEHVVKLHIYASKGEVIRTALKEFIQKESPFIQSLKFDLEKLNDTHRKYIEFKEKVIEEISPKISTERFIND